MTKRYRKTQLQKRIHLQQEIQSKTFRQFVAFEIPTWPTTLVEQNSPRSAGLLRRRPGAGLTNGKLCNDMLSDCELVSVALISPHSTCLQLALASLLLSKIPKIKTTIVTLRKNVPHNFSFDNHVYLFSYELSHFRYFARACLECS